MAITKILNIKESEGRNPASHLKNALEYIQNPDKTEECVLVGGINCLPDTAFEQMEETKNIFHKTGKRQGYHVIISFSPEEKVTAEQAMYVLEHFAKDVLGDDYEVVYAVHTDREHMHGHLIWNSVSMTTGKKYNSPKSNWKNHLQPITNKYCDELGLSIMPAEYSKNPKNISRDKWEKEMSMKEIILRDAKMCAYAAGNVEHFKYLMKRLGYVFKKDAWMEVQAPGFRYYHKLAKMDEMFSEDMLRHYVDMPWMSKPYFYSSDIRGLHRAKLSPYQKRFYSKLYRLRIVEQKRFIVGGAKYTEDLKRFHRLQDEYLLLVNNDIKSVVDLVDFISEQEEKIQQIEDRQHEIYRESSSRKRNIKTEAQYRKYQIWHVEVQEKLDELKQEKRKIKRQLQLADDIIKEDLYTAYYAVSGKEEIVADRDVEIPGMEEDMLVERTAGAVVESERNVVVMNQPANSHNDGNGQEEQINVAGKQQIDLEGTEMSKVHNLSDENVTRMDEGITDVTGKSELVEHEEKEPVDKAGWIVRRISELGGYENVSDSVKADIFGFDIADAVHFSVRDDGVIRKLAAYVVLGMNEDGMKEVLSIVVGENESSKYWLSVLNSLKNRGVQDILILCSDGLTGIKDAISTAFPKTEQQRCIVHMVRNTLKYVANKDMKAFAKDLKTIYTAADEETARKQLESVTEKWSAQYPSAMNRWHENWDAISPIFKFSKEVRTAFYTTNAIESLNSCYRRLNKQRSVFPSSQALMKALYLGTFEIAKKWTMPIRNWGKVRGELEIMYPDRMLI